ncbi:MAG TPA: patatin-like phospholipase family protein [Steroidobacteraceae bacterium]|nr:patatin-like phospholipase family protein [Steroidobacteraceae bacterium]
MSTLLAPRAHAAIALVTTLLLGLAITCRADPAPASGRPRIGLVLAGGGAKGGAHVGVLKVLEELHVPVDCIAGTSMGALIGGGYASGIPASELEKFLKGIDWKKVVGSQGRRGLEPIEQKRAGATYSNDFEFGLSSDGIVAPGGLVNTSNIEDLLRTYVATARLETDFSKLPIPFRAVATDMVSGTMVVLDQGDLATAMRASMAIPGAFAPVLMDDKILSDGGLVRNIPVDVARKLCADVVIVVNLVEPPADPKKLHSATQLLSRTMDVMIEANETLQLNAIGSNDIRIDVFMGDITTADFERVPETIPLGESAARSMAAALSRYSVPEPEYLAWRKSVTASQQLEARLAGVRFEGLKHVNPEFLASIDTVKAGDLVDTARISNEAQRMSALQDFDSVGYRLDGDRESPTLTWLPREKNWGPNYLKLDLGLYASEDGDLTFALYGRHVRTWVNSLGAEWRNEVQLGGDTLVSSGFLQPLDAGHRVFVEPRVFFNHTLENIFENGERVARYIFSDLAGQVDFGLNMGPYAQARIGYLYSRRKVEVDIGSTLLPEGSPRDAGVTSSIVYDSRDTAFNPTRGLAMALEYMRSDNSLGADRDWQRAELGVGVAVPLRRDVLWVTAAGGSDLGSDLPGDRLFALGGPGSFPGFDLEELRAGQYWTVGTSYLWRVKDMLSIKNLALYAGVRLAAGATYDRMNPADDGDFYGGSVFLTGRTMVGPLTVGLGATSNDSWSLWISVGRPIGHGTILEKGIFR